MSSQTVANRIAIFLDNMQFARDYTKSLLEGLSDEQWFWSPGPSSTPVEATTNGPSSRTSISGAPPGDASQGAATQGAATQGAATQGAATQGAAAEGDSTPMAYATHIAWQVGHLAMAQYGLCLFRQRGRLSEDNQLMSSGFRKRFMKGTTPNPDAESYPKPDEIVDVLDRVHHQVLQEVSEFDNESLDEPIDPPTAAYDTRYGSLLMAVNHEMLHAGQIGMLRRLMGLAPIR